MAEVRITADSFTVTIWPESANCEHSALWCVTVARREHGTWAVLRGGARSRVCLAADGRWDVEPVPAARDDAWLADHRFDMDTAIDAASKHAPRVIVNGIVAVHALASHEKVCRG